MRLSDNESIGTVLMLAAMSCFAAGVVSFENKLFLGFAWVVALGMFLAGIVFLVEDGPERFYYWVRPKLVDVWWFFRRPSRGWW